MTITLSERTTVEEQHEFLQVHITYELVADESIAAWRRSELEALEREFCGTPATLSDKGPVIGRGQSETPSVEVFNSKPFNRVRPPRP